MTNNIKVSSGLSVALLCVLAFFCACSKSGGSSAGNGNFSYSGTIIHDQAGNALAECTNGVGNLAGRMKVYRLNNTFDYSRVKVRLTQNIPADDNYGVRFFRWKQTAPGSYYVDGGNSTPTPLRIDVEYNGQTIRSSLNLVKTSDLNGLSFSQVDLIVYGTEIESGYQVIQGVLYAGATSSTYSNFLIPFFSASPSQYVNGHIGLDFLQPLHPYYARRNESISPDNWARMSYSDFCF